MGMFDDVNFECTCPVCHSKVDGFQSKSGECVLDHIEPDTVDNFYASCRKCGCWIEYVAKPVKYNRFTRYVEGKAKNGKRELLKEYTKEINLN